jgi:transposase-like protein
MEARKIRDEGDARQCLAAAAASGRARAVWAREHGVDARSLNAWRLTLERRTARRPRLVELVTTPPPPSVYRVRCGAFEIETPADFDDASLGRLLRLVASC